MIGADTLLVAAVVAIALAFLAWRGLRRSGGKKGPCGCGGCPGARAKDRTVGPPEIDSPS